MYKTVIAKETVDNIFSNSASQYDVVIGLYRELFGSDYDKIEKLHAFPHSSKEFNDYIFKKFIEFDKAHHPDVLAGGMWLNHGFSTAEMNDIKLESEWQIVFCNVDNIEWKRLAAA